ncbi:hypothetical protein BKA62DRAFT_784903 [Auriculariales sp. MPI-PUGE-AT-0066]|nr:hypothetical protein BKA62DRAFT_784903 [Auriculariales sp. MPI-PUGE-AT-0066]
MRSTYFFSLLTVAVFVLAHDPPTLPQCATDCATKAATDTKCGTFSEPACVCDSEPFLTATITCIKANCTPEEHAAAEQAAAAICSTDTGTDTAGPSETGAGSASATGSQSGGGGSASHSGSATSSGAASGTGTGSLPAATATLPAPGGAAVCLGAQGVFVALAAAVGVVAAAL